MSFTPHHYEHIKDFLRYYAESLGYGDIVTIMDRGISTEQEAKTFCNFITVLIDQRLADEKSSKQFLVEIGSAPTY